MHSASEKDPSTPWYLPFLKEPVLFHSSRDAGHCKLTPERCAYKSARWVFWYEADHVFALPTVYFFVAVIAVFAISHFTSEYASTRLSHGRVWRRFIAALRFLSYRNVWLVGHNSQSLGVYLLGAVGVVFFAAMTLGPGVYYWPTDAHYGNSPPIATRTGWMALACMPFVLALGAKASMVTALTGIPHEKLNVWHNWISWAMFVLALIHTFPFVVYHQWVGDLHDVFVDGGLWITGVIALIAQAWLTFMSISWIRNRYYEFFKATHIFFAVAFVVFFFLHCQFTLSSWDYFIASVALYVPCLLYSYGKVYLKHGINHKARLRLETSHALRIAVETKSSWAPGQHIFLRFLTCGVHALTSHPLTICSIPSKNAKGGELVFYVQPRDGLTGRLASLAQKQPDMSVRVLLEGPYGGLPKRWSRGFDRTLLVAGGSGSGFTLSLIEDWLHNRKDEPGRELQVVLATRDPQMRIWYMEELQQMAVRQSEQNLEEIPGLSICFHETNASQNEKHAVVNETSGGSDDEKAIKQVPKTDQAQVGSQDDSSSIASRFGVKFYRGRPDVKKAVDDLASQQNVTVGVTVCGPSGMVHDVSCGAAAAQQRILRGDSGASEMWYHKESFSY